jgi:Tfp pilus assembly protein FimT
MLCVVIAILSAMAVPAFLSYYQAAIMKSGAQQVAVLVNQARKLGINESGRVCVKLPGSCSQRVLVSTLRTGRVAFRRLGWAERYALARDSNERSSHGGS